MATTGTWYDFSVVVGVAFVVDLLERLKIKFYLSFHATSLQEATALLMLV